MRHKILVIMPVINLWNEYTIHALESIAASKNVTRRILEVDDNQAHDETVETHVLIVDQGSTDVTMEHAEDFGRRKMLGRMHLLHLVQNIGCAGGWNTGVKWGIDNGFTHLILANNDILVGPKTISGMYHRMERDPKVLLCSAVDVIKEVPVPQMVLDENNGVNDKLDSEAPHPNFSFFMITPETIEKVGWFDEEFYPAYFEDNDYHYRLKLAGGNDCAIANTLAVFIHYGSRTQNQAMSAPIVHGELFRKNGDYFARKWGGAPTHEVFTLPFNDSSKDITYAKRSQ